MIPFELGKRQLITSKINAVTLSQFLLMLLWVGAKECNSRLVYLSLVSPCTDFILLSV